MIYFATKRTSLSSALSIAAVTYSQPYTEERAPQLSSSSPDTFRSDFTRATRRHAARRLLIILGGVLDRRDNEINLSYSFALSLSLSLSASVSVLARAAANGPSRNN